MKKRKKIIPHCIFYTHAESYMSEGEPTPSDITIIFLPVDKKENPSNSPPDSPPSVHVSAE